MFEYEIVTFLWLNDLEYKKPKEKTLIEDAELHSWRGVSKVDEKFFPYGTLIFIMQQRVYPLANHNSSQLKIIKAKLQSAQAVKLVAFTKTNVQSLLRVGLGSLWCAAVMRGSLTKKGIIGK